jgi:hypothetical protein
MAFVVQPQSNDPIRRQEVSVSFDQPGSIHRTALLFLGKDVPSPEEAEATLRRLVLQVHVGPGACPGRSGTAALATIVNAGRRAFLGGVRVLIDEDLEVNYGWAERRRLSELVEDLGGTVVDVLDPGFPTLALGHPTDAVGLVVLYPTWHGWAAGVVLTSGDRRDDHGVEIAAIAAAALGVSEAFQFVTGPVGPGRRDVGVSLWNPEVDWRSDEAVGPMLSCLPSKLWLLGLGHLGQGYAWSIGWLNYADPASILVALVDDDIVEGGNDATGMLLRPSDEGSPKTRVVARELERIGIRTRLVERRFDEHFAVQDREPVLALAGFDRPEPRQLLGGPFKRVVDGGLGIGSREYLSIAIHTFPSTLDPAVVFRANGASIDGLTEDQEALVERLIAQGVPEGTARCGVTTVAGIAIAAAFVGTFAGTLVLADVLRSLHRGPAVCAIRCDLRTPADLRCAPNTAPGPPINPGFTAPAESLGADAF